MAIHIITWEVPDDKNLRYLQKEENISDCVIQKYLGTMKTNPKNQYELGKVKVMGWGKEGILFVRNQKKKMFGNEREYKVCPRGNT